MPKNIHVTVELVQDDEAGVIWLIAQRENPDGLIYHVLSIPIDDGPIILGANIPKNLGFDVDENGVPVVKSARMIKLYPPRTKVRSLSGYRRPDGWFVWDNDRFPPEPPKPVMVEGKAGVILGWNSFRDHYRREIEKGLVIKHNDGSVGLYSFDLVQHLT